MPFLYPQDTATNKEIGSHCASALCSLRRIVHFLKNRVNETHYSKQRGFERKTLLTGTSASLCENLIVALEDLMGLCSRNGMSGPTATILATLALANSAWYGGIDLSYRS